MSKTKKLLSILDSLANILKGKAMLVLTPASEAPEEPTIADTDFVLVTLASGGFRKVRISNLLAGIGGGSVAIHHANHQHGGTDEVATSAPAANAIPKANSSGKLDAWITQGSESTPGTIQLASNGETSAGKAVQGNDSRIGKILAVPTTGIPAAATQIDVVEDQGLTLTLDESSGQKSAIISVLDASTTDKGVVLLADEEDVTPGHALQASDTRVGTIILTPSGVGDPTRITKLDCNTAQGVSLVLTADGGFGFTGTISVEDATTSIPGVVLLTASSSDTSAGHVVQGNDDRLVRKLRTIVKDADETVNGNDTLQADNELTGTVAADKVYSFEILAHIEDNSAAAAGGFKAAIGGTFTPAWLIAQAEIVVNVNLAPFDIQRFTAKGDTVAVASADVSLCLKIKGSVSVSGSGSFTLFWAQANFESGGSGVTVLKGSHMELKEKQL